MNCVRCNNAIELERLEAIPTTRACCSCAQKGVDQKPQPKGVLCFDHKTGGSIQIVSPENFAVHRRYNPYGRYPGRGSGVHRMSRSTAHI